jgi:hypothetical protein
MPRFKPAGQVSPDSKGRVTLGKFAKGVSSFRITVDSEGRVLLEPFVEIPAREQWLFNNREALKSVRKGLRESAEGKTESLGSFAKYLKDGDTE